jgi:hypothetical protein
MTAHRWPPPAPAPVAVADARSATNTFNTGLAMVGSGQADTGLVLMKAALTGPLPDPPRRGCSTHRRCTRPAGRPTRRKLV